MYNAPGQVKERMDILLLIDDTYLFYSIPFLYSLIKNNLAWAELYIHIASDNLSKYSQKLLERLGMLWNVAIEICQIDVSQFKALKYSARYPALLYYKLVPHLILPSNIDRAIFFDVDMICVKSLHDLFKIDLGENYFALCYGINSFKAYIQGITEGIEANYHNSGVMLINLKKLREDEVNIETYLNYSKTHNQGKLLEEFFLNHIYYGKILSLMPYDYNYNVGGRKLYSEFCNMKQITPKKAIIHYMPFGNDSPIVKPWDAYEYFYYNRKNDIFSDEIYELIKLWWDYAYQLPEYVLLGLVKDAQNKKIEHQKGNIATDRNKWQTYSNSFKKLIQSNLLQLCKDGSVALEKVLSEAGYRHIAFYADTEITKVLCYVLKGTSIKIDYIVTNDPVHYIEVHTIKRDAAEFPPVDLMLVADVVSYQAIADKLKRLKVTFPFANAAEFIRSLPVGEGIDALKNFVHSLQEAKKEAVVLLDKRQFELEEARARKDELLKEKGVLESTINDLQKQAKNLTEQADILNKENEKVRQKVNALQNEKLSVENKLQKMRRESEIDKKQISMLSNRYNEAKNEVISLKTSLSFRIGRAVTFLPRKIRDAFKKK